MPVRGTEYGARVRWSIGLLAVLLAIGMLPATASAQANGEAVILVSGFTSTSPFTTTVPECAGQEGGTFSPTVAPTLKAAGLQVFTAPESPRGAPPANCTGPGQPTPPADATIDTEGDIDANGEALARFVAFLRDSYGVTSVQFIGHSDGGLWSRSAISHSAAYAGVLVRSLNTVATPHTGSPAADGGEQVLGVDCNVPDRRTKSTCKTVQGEDELLFALAGDTGIAELTSTFLTSWGAQQPFGDCPVTTLAGDAYSIPATSRQVPNYYNPSDGVVGFASAHAQASRNLAGAQIPAPGFRRLINGGTVDAVHISLLSINGLPSELSLQSLADRLLQAVQEGATNDIPCNGAPRPRTAGKPETTTLPLATIVASSKAGRLPPLRTGDQITAPRGTDVRCGGRSLVGPVPPGIPQVYLVPVAPCRRSPTVSGGTALLLKRDQLRDAKVTIRSPRDVQVSIVGKAPRSFEVEVRSGTRWRRLRLDGRGRGHLSGSNAYAVLRVSADAEGDQQHTITAAFAR